MRDNCLSMAMLNLLTKPVKFSKDKSLELEMTALLQESRIYHQLQLKVK